MNQPCAHSAAATPTLKKDLFTKADDFKINFFFVRGGKKKNAKSRPFTNRE